MQTSDDTSAHVCEVASNERKDLPVDERKVPSPWARGLD